MKLQKIVRNTYTNSLTHSATYSFNHKYRFRFQYKFVENLLKILTSVFLFSRAEHVTPQMALPCQRQVSIIFSIFPSVKMVGSSFHTI